MLHDRLSFGALAAVSFLGVFLVAAPTWAADLDPALVDAPQVIPQSNVVFGSGWYIRGDIGATYVPEISATSTVLGQAPTAILSSSHRVGYVASLGAGYEINQWFRSDLVADFHQPLQSSTTGSSFSCPIGFNVVNGQSQLNNSGLCTGHNNAEIKSFDVLVNGYVDLGHWYGVTPYVGAGVGLSFGNYSTSSTYTQFDGTSYNLYITDPISGATYHEDYDHNASGNYYNLAFALMAGFSVDIFDHTKLDVGYRYLHLGQVLSSNLTTQEVRVGLRYMIDN